MSKRDEMAGDLIRQAQTMSNAQALKHGRATLKLWRAVNSALNFMGADNTAMNRALWVLGVCTSRLVHLGLDPDEVMDMVYANLMAGKAQNERAAEAVLDAATRGQTEN